MREAPSQLRAIGEMADTNPETLGADTDPHAHFKYVDLSSVTTGSVAWNLAPEVTFLTAPSRARRLLRRGDVLFGTVRPNLQSHGYVDWDGNGALVGSTGFSIIRAKHGVSDSRYLFHCVMSSGVLAQANRDAVGSSYPAVNDGDVRQFKVYAPPIDEQVAVAQVLDTLDATIRQTEAIIEKLKQVKQGLLHDLLTRGIDANGELRPPQSEAPHLYKDSPLGWIPRNWKTMPLGHLISDHQSGVYKNRSLYGEGENIVGVADLFRHDSIDGQEFRRVRTSAMERTRFRLSAGDLVYAESSLVLDGIAKTVAVSEAGEGTLFAWHTRRLTPEASKVLPFFLALTLGTPSCRKHVISRATQTALTGIPVAEYLTTPVPIPSLDEQREIVARLDAADTRRRTEVRFAAKMQTLKSGLMDDLLTGRVRVTPLLA